LGKSHLLIGQVDDAMPLLRKAAAMKSRNLVCSSEAGGRSVLKVRSKRQGPSLPDGQIEAGDELSGIRAWEPFRNPKFTTLHDRTVIQGLRNAGFPEEVVAQ